MDSKDTEMSCRATPHPRKSFSKVDFFMRLSVFVSNIVGIILELSSKQTGVIGKGPNSEPIYKTVKFSDSSAFIYLTSALAVTAVSSIFTIAFSIYNYRKLSSKNLLLLIITDLLMLGIMANAIGAAGQFTYTGLKDDPNFCSNFDKYCKQVGGTIAGSVVTSITLMVLVVLSSYSLLRRCK